VPGAICFDLLNGGNKAWGRFPPYRDLAYAAATAAGTDFALGSVGAGLGATTANFKGGLGSASAQTEGGVMVAALAVVNAVGSVTVGDGPWFWAAPFEVDGEFGGQGLPPSFTAAMLKARLKGGPDATSSENTTLVVVVTDAVLTKSQAKRLAMIAQTGMARAIYPVHAPTDGDVVFAAATGSKPVDPLYGLTELGMVAANTVSRAIARGVHTATALPFLGALPAWRDRFG
jgi:L-aminopeptidase/D-esterase-like protein